MFDYFSSQELAASVKPFALSPVANPRIAPKPSIFSRLTGLYNVPGLGLLNTSVGAAPNVAIVQRTWGVLQQEPSRQKEFYGPNFSYKELAKAKNIAAGIAMHYGILIVGALLMFVPPFRALVRRFVFKPGEGPSKEDSANDYVELRGVASPDLPDSRKQAFVKARYSGSMYHCEYARTLISYFVYLQLQ